MWIEIKRRLDRIPGGLPILAAFPGGGGDTISVRLDGMDRIGGDTGMAA